MTGALAVLVVDVDALARCSLSSVLRAAGCRVRVTESIEAALRAVEECTFDVMVLGQRLPGADDLIQRARLGDPGPIVLRSADVVRPSLRDGAGATAPSCELTMIGESPAMERVRRTMARMATSDATILITGESGTGKDLAARVLHEHSRRAGRPFMVITCTALPEPLLESEMFGHERGAFTDARESRVGLLQAAEGGTVFLDEIGDMSLALQAKLLRFLEEHMIRRVGGSTELRVDVRVIAATNVDLVEAVRRRTFRADLYYRLAVLELPLPPLRERSGDVLLLARHFLGLFGRQQGRSVPQVTGPAWNLLAGHDWPGNIRELRNVLERTLLLLESDVLDESDVRMSAVARAPGRVELPPQGIDLAGLERALILQAVERARGNYTEAGRMLGLHRDQVRYRLSKYGLAAKRRPGGERRGVSDISG